MLPWLFFAPAVLKGFRLGGAAYRKQPLFLIPAAAVAVWLAAVILWNGRLPDGTPAAGFPMLAILMAGGLVRYGEAGDLVYVNTVLRSLVRIFLPLPLLLFLLQSHTLLQKGQESLHQNLSIHTDLGYSKHS